jgi:hypothetical protein
MTYAPKHAIVRRWWTLDGGECRDAHGRARRDRHQYRASARTVGLAFLQRQSSVAITAYALAFGSLLLLGGRLSDLWGRRNDDLIHRTDWLRSGVGARWRGSQFHNAGHCARHSRCSLVRCSPRRRSRHSPPRFKNPRNEPRPFPSTVRSRVGGRHWTLGRWRALTQWASWRWCLFINLFFAAFALVGVCCSSTRERANTRPTSTSSGTVLASGGLFFVVYALGHAVTTSWSDDDRRGRVWCSAWLLLYSSSSGNERKFPLLPLRVVATHARRFTDRAVHHEHRDLWHLAVPRLLHASHARVLTYAHGHRVPALGGPLPYIGVRGERAPARQDRTASARSGRHGAGNDGHDPLHQVAAQLRLHRSRVARTHRHRSRSRSDLRTRDGECDGGQSKQRDAGAASAWSTRPSR